MSVRKIAFSIGALACMIAVAAFAAGGEGRTLITVGQVEGVPSFPLAQLEQQLPNVRLEERSLFRSELYPSQDPLPNTLSELPDIVNPLVGYWDNDLSALVENELIEPLDSLLAEVGIEPSDFLTPQVLAAVSLHGKIWAIPHRFEAYMVAYNKKVLEQLGVQPRFNSWDELFKTAVRISNEAVPGRKIPGFEMERLGKVDHIFAALMQLSASTGTGESVVVLVNQYQEALLPADDYYQSPDHVFAFNIELLSHVVVGSTQGCIPPPVLLTPNSKASFRPVCYMECFAIRKNTPEKKAACVAVLKKILQKETQMALVSQTLMSKPAGDLAYRHLPWLTSIANGKEFNDITKTIPEYQGALDALRQADIAAADRASTAPRAAAIARKKEAAQSMWQNMGEAAAYLALLAPFEPAPPANPSEAKAKSPDVSQY